MNLQVLDAVVILHNLIYWAVTALRNWKQIRAQIGGFYIHIYLHNKYSTHELQETSRNEETKAMTYVPKYSCFGIRIIKGLKQRMKRGLEKRDSFP